MNDAASEIVLRLSIELIETDCLKRKGDVKKPHYA
jgi:hypothetical protein